MALLVDGEQDIDIQEGREYCSDGDDHGHS